MSFMEADERQEMMNHFRQGAEKCVLYYDALVDAGATPELAVAVVGAWCTPTPTGMPAAVVERMVEVMTRMAPPEDEDG